MSDPTALSTIEPFRIAVADRHSDDGGGRPGAVPVAVYAPSTTADCAAILRALNAAGQPCVVQGGRTGLAGGARVRPGEVVLSTERLRDPPRVDPVAGTLRVGAGIALQEAQQVAAEAGWMLAADLGARGSATIGGMIATNAGGPLAVRFGTFRNQVLGLEAVLPGGEIVSRMGGLWKDNTGYDLPAMIMASEGTLGIVTAAVLRLHPRARVQAAALCACADIATAQDLLGRLRTRFGVLLQACEFMVAPLLDMAVAHRGVPAPLAAGASCHLLVELASTLELDLETLLTEGLAAEMDGGPLLDAVLSQSERDRWAFWALREGCNEALDRAHAPLTSLDLSLPVRQIAAFLERARTLDGVAATSFAFGHLADGNVHYILAGEGQEDRIEPLLRLAAEMGGVVTAEHGLGLDKAAYLGLCRPPGEIAVMRRVKAALDPANILNPGRVLTELPSPPE